MCRHLVRRLCAAWAHGWRRMAVSARSDGSIERSAVIGDIFYAKGNDGSAGMAAGERSFVFVLAHTGCRIVQNGYLQRGQ
jgi:hypothetical protein